MLPISKGLFISDSSPSQGEETLPEGSRSLQGRATRPEKEEHTLSTHGRTEGETVAKALEIKSRHLRMQRGRY